MNYTEVAKELAKHHFIYISIGIETLGSDEWEYAYTIVYLPKEFWDVKRRAPHLVTIRSFAFSGGATYMGAWPDYDMCWDEAIKHANKLLGT